MNPVPLARLQPGALREEVLLQRRLQAANKRLVVVGLGAQLLLKLSNYKPVSSYKPRCQVQACISTSKRMHGMNQTEAASER